MVTPDGQRHYHDNGICWTKVVAGITTAEADALAASTTPVLP